jgi:hypothetical protein
MHYAITDAEMFSALCYPPLCLNCCDLQVFLFPKFCENMPPKKQIVPKKQSKSYGNPPKLQRTPQNVLNLSDKVSF